jgi:hypothetical protein
MAKWLTRWSAKPVFMGSNPIRCSIILQSFTSVRAEALPTATPIELAPSLFMNGVSEMSQNGNLERLTELGTSFNLFGKVPSSGEEADEHPI